jgi:serine protease inhibitor
MLVTEPSQFQVVRKQNGNLWLEVQEKRDQGRRVSVPLFHGDYDDEIEDALDSMSVGDLCVLTLQSDSEKAPDWRVLDIEDVPR